MPSNGIESVVSLGRVPGPEPVCEGWIQGGEAEGVPMQKERNEGDACVNNEMLNLTHD